MVLRSTIPTAREAAREATEQLEELAKAQGRGGPALRSPSGSVLEFHTSASVPTLSHTDAGVGIQFQNGKVSVTDAAGIEARDFSVRALSTSGQVSGTSAQFSGGVGATGGFYGNIGDPVLNGYALNGHHYGISTGTHEGPHYGNCGDPGIGYTYYGAVVPVSQEARKEQVRELDGPASRAIRDVRWRLYRYRAGHGPAAGEPEADFMGPMVEQLADHPVLASVVRRDADGVAVGFDLHSLVGFIGQATGEHANELDELRAQRDADRARIDALEARVSALEGR